MTWALVAGLVGTLFYLVYELGKRRAAEVKVRVLRANLDHCSRTNKVLKDKLDGARDSRVYTSKKLIELQKRIADEAPDLAATLLRERLRAHPDSDDTE